MNGWVSGWVGKGGIRHFFPLWMSVWVGGWAQAWVGGWVDRKRKEDEAYMYLR